MKKENNDFKKEGIIKKLWEKLDVVIASGGVLLGLFIICVSFITIAKPWYLGVTILISSVLYIIFRERLFNTNESFHFVPTKKLIYVNDIIFFLTVSLSVWLLFDNLYHRPLFYFLLVTVACSSIALEILYSNEKWVSLILIKILLVGITIYGGVYYQFPNDISGLDTKFHNSLVKEVIENGYVIPNQPYTSFPLFHILTSSTSILTSLNVHSSIFISITFLLAFSTLFIFLLGQKLINTRVGLLASLLFIFGDQIILFSIWAIPQVLAFVFFIIILYLFIISTHSSLHRRIIIIFLFFVVILTHTIGGFAILVITLSLFTWKKIYKMFYNLQNDKFTIFLSTFIVFATILSGYWMYTFQCSTCNSFFDAELHALLNGLMQDITIGAGSHYIPIKMQDDETCGYFEYILTYLGYLIFLAIGIIGTYIWFRDKNIFKSSLCFSMIIVFAIIYGFSYMGLRTVIPDRWFIYTYVILALTSAVGIFKLVSLSNKKLINIFIFIIITAVLCFFMISTTTSNYHDPIYCKDNGWRFVYKTSELQGNKTIHLFFNGTYGVISLETISPLYNFTQDTGKMYILYKDANNTSMYGAPVKFKNDIRMKKFKVPNEFKAKLDFNGNKIYDNGETWGYIIRVVAN